MDARTLTYTAISVIGFGVWGFFMKLGQERLGALPHLTTMGLIVAIIVAIGIFGDKLPLPKFNSNLWLPLGATLATLVAMLFLTLALGSSSGSTASVVALSALYPGITAILATVILGEDFSHAKLAGLCCAAAAAYLFTR